MAHLVVFGVHLLHPQEENQLFYQNYWASSSLLSEPNVMKQTAQLSAWIKEEGLHWVLAGYSVLSDFLQ
jgi:hypothetical protein